MLTGTLNDLDEELCLLLDYLDSEDGEAVEIAEKLFAELLPKLEEKIDSYVRVIRERENLASFQRRESARCDKLARVNENTARRLKARLLVFMEERVVALGERGKRLEGRLSRVTLCRDGGKPPIWIDPDLAIEEFPERFVEYVPRLKRDELLRAVSEEGELIDDRGRSIGKVLQRGNHLRFL